MSVESYNLMSFYINSSSQFVIGSWMVGVRINGTITKQI